MIGLELAIFGLPSLISVAGALRWVRKRNGSSLRLVADYCATSAAMSFILLILAHPQYAPAD